MPTGFIAFIRHILCIQFRKWSYRIEYLRWIMDVDEATISRWATLALCYLDTVDMACSPPPSLLRPPGLGSAAQGQQLKRRGELDVATSLIMNGRLHRTI